MLKKSSNFKVVFPFGNVKSAFLSSCRGTFPKLISSDKNYVDAPSFYCELSIFYCDGFTPLITLGLLLFVTKGKNKVYIQRKINIELTRIYHSGF
jgi:hypothetical protein